MDGPDTTLAKLLARKSGRTDRPAQDEAERRRRRAAACKIYNQSPRGRYRQAKRNALTRDIPWELSYEEWCTLWAESGHWDQRGNTTREGYVMARHGDCGPYRVGNVSIITHAENVAERNRLYFNPAPDIGSDEWLSREHVWAWWDDSHEDFMALAVAPF